MNNNVRKLIFTGGVVGSVYAADEFYWYHTLRRSLRAAGVGMYTVYQYKMVWSPETSSLVNQRVACAITQCCLENEGLYVKIGQALNSMAAILPKEYTENLSALLDRAKTYDFQVINNIVERELGTGIVGSIDPIPVGSASLAQVHKAIFLTTGETVAVKVQKPNVSMQAYWDLWMYRILMKVLEWSFDIPLYWSVDFTTQHFVAELDFRKEGRNSDLAKSQLEQLGDIVYVPRVLHATERVLVTEWIDDTVMISDVKQLTQRKFDRKKIILDATKVFGFQVFQTGHVHCDPHFGNLLIRNHPNHPGRHQVVLIDHGLYVDLPDSLRKDYARLWIAMAPPRDTKTAEEICRGWGIGSVDVFQAIIRQSRLEIGSKPGDPKTKTDKALEDPSVRMKDRLKELLQDTSRFPKELILVGRCMNYIRAANWSHGSPIDRVAILVECAKDATANDAKGSSGKGWLISIGSFFAKYLHSSSSYNKEVESAPAI